MRNAFFSALTELADDDPRVLLLTGDLGFMAVEPFAERHPDRFVNAGVAEQNMVGMATGLAEAGYVPFVYSIATFAALRSYEFIRNGPVLHDLPVRIVGVGGGPRLRPERDHALGARGRRGAAPAAGARRDRAGRRPADRERGARDGRARRPGLPAAGAHAAPRSPASTAASRSDARTCSATAPTSRSSRSATWPRRRSRPQAQLAASGVARARRRRLVRPPRPDARSRDALAGVPLAITVESHYVDGGLGSLTAEVVAENGLGTRLVRAGVRRSPAGETGSAAFLHERHGLSASALAASALDQLARRPRPLRRPA